MKKCENCEYVDIFKPRKDEIENGQLLGCIYPNFQGYVKSENAEKCSTYSQKDKLC